MLTNLLLSLVPGAQTLGQVHGPSYHVADYDRDGRPDVFVVDPRANERLFRNLTDGAFIDVTTEAGLTGITGSRAVLWEDFDGDGFADLYVGSRTGESRLFQNTGAGSFVDVSAHAGIGRSPAAELDARVLDYDLDGRPDLLLSTEAGERFLHNVGSGRFEPVELVPLDPPAPDSNGVVIVPAAGSDAGDLGPDESASSSSSHGGSTATWLGSASAACPRPAMGAPGLALPASPSQPSGPVTVAAPCSESLRDATTGLCGLLASSAPTLGMLYPLSNAFNVDASGHVGIGTSTPSASLHVSGDDGFVASGRIGFGALPASGPGTRLMWYPAKAALRAGRVEGDRWDDDNIGFGSIGLGENSLAIGHYSVALGRRSHAASDYGLALGFKAQAYGYGAVAVGTNLRSRGYESVAFGIETVATGYHSTAIGHRTGASGRYSTAIGVLNHAESLYATSLGVWNIGGGDPSQWVGTDPLFEIGNGLRASRPSNALTVLKNGRVGIGTATPQFRLEVNGSAAKPGGGSWSVSSDARLKKDVRTIDGALDTVLALRGVSFEYVDPEAIGELPGPRIGFVAQEVEKVLPDWVEEVGGYKRLTIRGFEALAVEAMRQLERENEALRSRCEAQDAELAVLRQRVSSLEDLGASVARLQTSLARLENTR